jgi:hypothetical protein
MSGMDFMGVSKPNERKYFDETKGCTLNTKCADCGTPQYQPEGVYTVYHGQCYVHNSRDEIMGIATLKGGAIGVVCLACWLKEYPDEKKNFKKYMKFIGNREGSGKPATKSATAPRKNHNRVEAKSAKTKHKSRARAS